MSLSFAFWSWNTHTNYLDFTYSDNPGIFILRDLGLSSLFLMLAVAVTGTSIVTARVFLRSRQIKSGSNIARKENAGRPGIFVAASALLSLLFIVGAALYAAKTFHTLKEALCATQRRVDQGNIVPALMCRSLEQGGFIEDTVDRKLSWAFALFAQAILLIANGVLIYYTSLFSYMYIPIAAVYVGWIALSFVEIYTFRLDFPEGQPGGTTIADLTRHKGSVLNAWYAISVLINAIVTATVATKRIRKIRKAGADNFALSLARVLLVEAALPPTLCVLAVAIAYGAQNGEFDLSAALVRRVWAALWLASSVVAVHLFAIRSLQPTVTCDEEKEKS
ncbi:hypothetical protein MD484_g7673, partial [Candolleomyces efflorescens]